MEAPLVLSRPVDKQFPITQRFGEHPENYSSTHGHTGIDFDTPEGTPVMAAADGIVTEAGMHKRSQEEPDKGYGWYVRIQHPDKWNTLYTQLQPQGVMVQPNMEVRRGQVIGLSGNSGKASERPRLHFELRSGPSVSTATDPLPYLQEQDAAPESLRPQPGIPQPTLSVETPPAQTTEPGTPDASGTASQPEAQKTAGTTPNAAGTASPPEPQQTTGTPPDTGPAQGSAADKAQDAAQSGVNEPAATPSATRASLTLQTPTNTVEYRKGGTLLRVAEIASPWRMAIDGMASPAGNPYGALNGSFNTNWFQDTGPANENALRGLVESLDNILVGSVVSLVPDTELGVKLLPFGGDGPRHIIIASAFGSDGATRLANIPPMLRQIVQQAASQGVHKLAIPLIGAGGGGLNPLRVANAMLTTLLGEIDLGGIEVITITAMQPEVVEAARQKLNLYRNNLAQAFATDEASEKDMLGIGPQVDALAETLMLRDMPGGIAVGILGSWGSGKTSVMKMIEARCKALVKDPHGKPWIDEPGDEQLSPYVGHVYPIWFNAWTYAKANLWASLMDTIFGTLAYLLQTDPNRPDKTADMWEILRSRKREAWNALQDQEQRLAQYTAESKDLALTYQQQAQVELGKQGQTVAWNAFTAEVGQVAGALVQGKIKDDLEKQGVEKDAIAVANELRSLNTIVKRLIEIFKNNPLGALVWLAFSLACIILPIVLAPVVHILNNGLVWLAGWIPMLLPPLRIVTSWLKQVDQSLEAYRTREEQEHRRLQGLADEWVRKKLASEEEQVRSILNDGSKSPAEIEATLIQLARQKQVGVADAAGNVTTQTQLIPNNLAAYQALVKMQTAKVEQQRRRVGMVGRFTTLAEFIQSRLDSGFYENQLGPMHQVEKDIGELSEGLMFNKDALSPDDQAAIRAEMKKVFPRGPARVFLFIDDLDRCPPPRVVEVLEATQLLLKTPLFVVVLGLDTRYATRALEKEYKKILQHAGDPSGMDYIEKIIQIPYRVRPIEQTGLGSFLQSQMNPLEAETEPEPVQQVAPGAGNAPEQIPLPGQPGAPVAKGEPPANPPAQGTQPTSQVGEKAQVDAPPASPVAFKELPPAVVRFTFEDYEDVQACCQQIRLTPRSIKRLVNVMKLLEVFWFRTLGYDRERPIKRSVIALLTLAAAYPEVMVEIFTEMEVKFNDSQATQSSLGDYLNGLARESLRLPQVGRAVLIWQFERLLEDVRTLRAMDQPDGGADFLSITFGKMGIDTFNLVRSFSFIGDPAYTLEKADPDGKPNN
jgi:hypothetical protein